MDSINTIIWDWNGTLLNDVDVCIETINQLLTDRNLPQLTRKKYLEVFDFPVKDYYRRIGFNFEKEHFEIPAHQYIDLYYSKVSKTSLYDHAIETLNHFSKNNFHQLILSASEQSKLIELLYSFKIDNYFQKVFGLDHIFATSKVELGIEMLKNIDISPANACLIGDTTHDFEVARAIGCKCILIGNGHQSSEKLKKTGAVVVENIQEVMNVF